jgi:hypothetical protein
MLLLLLRRRQRLQKVPKKSSLPKEVIDHWPEILKDINIEVLPVEYLDSVLVHFDDGKVWEIDLTKNPHGIDMEEAIESLMIEYEDAIANVDFRLNTVRLKNDISARTKQFLKKRK